MKLTQIIHSFINPRRLSENADFLQNKAKSGEKAQFTGVNEHFEPNFNVVLAERCVFGQPPRSLFGQSHSIEGRKIYSKMLNNCDHPLKAALQ